MMHPNHDNLALRVDGLGKAYRVSAAGNNPAPPYRTLREDLVNLARRPFKRGGEPRQTLFWALRDVTFEVERGAALGIIGANGAGKSTLLKLLSRITRPTAGTADLYGRVGSLLEVGTGFHQELTGRENIFLAGAVLGMARAEIRQRFDAIVAFSETEAFLDTPVKRYSTGMYMRLAFAVAAHLDTEILLVDEVLAVGDAAFQKKSLGKMGDVTGEGRTVLFVSHNMAAISSLCPRTIRLAGGRIVEDGATPDVIRHYLADDAQQGRVDLTDWDGDRSGPGPYRLRFVYTRRLDGTITSQFAHGETMVVGMVLAGKAGLACQVAVAFRDGLGTMVLHLKSDDTRREMILQSEETCVEVQFDVPFNSGIYYMIVWYGDSLGHKFDRVGNCLSLTIDASQVLEGRNKGMVLVPARWEISEQSLSQ